MKKDTIYYGLDEWERLCSSVDEAVERIIDDNLVKIGDPDEVIFDRIEWPINLLCFKPREIPAETLIADDILEHLIERLDEEYADPEGSATKPTPRMRAWAEALAKVVKEEYVSWTCEPNGMAVVLTRKHVAESLPYPEPTPWITGQK